MSVYDFNQHERVNINIQTGRGNSNGSQMSRYQVDQDFINRSYANSNQMSVQLSRPTSKTALLVRQRREMLEQLSCYLCKGYLIDATTIDECMDSFCKSCIVIYLRTHSNCPKCGTLIHKTNPLCSIRSDKVLQDIVYKLVPGLYDDEMQRRREFYKGILTTSSDEDDDDDTSNQISGHAMNMSSEQYGIISHPKPFYKPTDSIDLSIEPHTKGEVSTIYYDNKRQSIVTCFTGNQQRQQQFSSMFSIVDKQQFKTYLRCPAKLTVLQLKRFIAAKFNVCRNDTIHLLYLNEMVRGDYSLIDIAYIYDWRGIEHMRLLYIIERDLSDLNVRECLAESQQRKVSLQHSVGTSTQTVKRVCINPTPNFYEVKSKNEVSTNSYRTTRSKVEQPTTLYRNNSSCQPQAPILRSNSSSSVSLDDPDHVARSSRSSNVSYKEIVTFSGQRRETKDQNQLVTPVEGSIDELSQSCHAKTKETRSASRRNIAEASSDCIPKINISLATLNQKATVRDSGDRTINTYSRVKFDKDLLSREVEQNNNIRQLVPYLGPRCSTGPHQVIAGPSHSTMVTVAGYTGIRSNHVMAVGTSSSSTVTNNQQNMFEAESSSSKVQIRSTHAEVKTSGSMTKSQPTPQLAFSFVTERGITIVRRLPNQEDSNHSHSQVSMTTSSTIGKTSQPVSVQQSTQQHPTSEASRSVNSYQHCAPTYDNQFYQSRPTTGGTQTSSSTSNGRSETATTARHLIKVKPVYKTFVDPTKLKSPNFKKLGYTARH